MQVHGAHSVITNRELQRWAAQLSSSDPAPLAAAAHGVYVARFRSETSRSSIQMAMLMAAPAAWRSPFTSAQDPPSLTTLLSGLTSMPAATASATASLESASMDAAVMTEGHDLAAAAATAALPGDLRSLARAAHAEVQRLFASTAFMDAHGLYSVDSGALHEWVHAAASTSSAGTAGLGHAGPQGFMQTGLNLYCQRLRHRAAREAARDAFAEAAARCTVPGVQALSIPEAFDVSAMQRPMAATSGLRRVWGHAAAALQRRQPFLLTGSSGCGKSSVLRALVSRQGLRLSQMELLPGALAYESRCQPRIP